MSVVNQVKTSFAVGQSPDSFGMRLVLLTPIMLVAAIFLISPNFNPQPSARSQPFGSDFLQEWVGGHIVLNGQGHQLYDLDYFRSVQHDESLLGFSWPDSKYFPPVYPPFYYAAMSLMALLSYPVAVYVWGLLSAIALVATGEVIWRCYDPAKPVFGKLFLASLIFAPLLFCWSMGHKSTFLLLILTGTFVLLKQGRDASAGMVFGLMAFKPHLAIVIGLAMVFERNWKFVGGAGLTVALLALASLTVGWQACVAYVQVCLGMGDYLQTGGYQLAQSHSLWGAASNLLQGVDPAWAPGLAKGLALVGVAAVIGILVRLLGVSCARSDREFDLQFSGLVLATVLIAPHFYTYDLVILLLPFTIFVSRFMNQQARRVSERIVLGVTIAFFLLAGTLESVAEATRVQLSVVALLGMLVMLAVSIRTETAG